MKSTAVVDRGDRDLIPNLIGVALAVAIVVYGLVNPKTPQLSPPCSPYPQCVVGLSPSPGNR